MTIQTLVKKINSLATDLYGLAIKRDMIYSILNNEDGVVSMEKNKEKMLIVIKDMKERLNALELSLTIQSKS